MNRKEIYTRFAACHGAERPVRLAEMLELHSSTVWAWRSGKNAIPLEWKKKLVDVNKLKQGTMKVSLERLELAVEKFGVTWEWLLEGRGDGPEPTH